MIYKAGEAEFEAIADNLDVYYLALDNRGYDLCALEGVHIIPIGFKHNQVTLLFSEDYGTPLSAVYKDGECPAQAILSKVEV